MYTIGFVGPSGTGKSFRSVTIANRYKADAIIDDGLLISKNKVLAGFSAKKEATIIAAVKRALFTDSEHVEDVKNAIEKNNIKRIMVLGTSVKMVNKIAIQLDIAPIDEIVHIEDVATKEEIQAATQTRRNEGKHVIPVPVPEIKRDFSGYFLHPLRQIKRRKNSAPTYDKSIIRPTFSYMGEYTISDSVLCSIAAHEAMNTDGVVRVNSVFVEISEMGAGLEIAVSLKYGTQIPKTAAQIQNAVIKSIDYHTSLNVIKADIYVKRLEM